MGAAEKRSVLVVDDEKTNIAALTHILTPEYTVYVSLNGQGAIEAASKFSPDIVLLDILMPGMDGYAVITALKSAEKTQNIPVIFLTAMTAPENEIKGLNLGAVDYIFKPFSRDLLLKRIELHLLLAMQKQELQRYSTDLEKIVAEKTQAVYELQNAILETLAELVEYRDNITGGHIERTQSYLRLLVNYSLQYGIYVEELSSWNIDLFIMSSQLHDVGKISIRDNILLKTEQLTDEELEAMKKHTSFGREIIEKIEKKTKESSFLEYAKILAGSHHEKWDGTGYPLGLKGGNIPLQGRLMTIVDVYDALTNRRHYKEAFSHEAAIEVIKSKSGTYFDPRLCEVFLRHEKEFDAVRREKAGLP